MRILSALGLRMLCVCMFASLIPLHSTISPAHAQSKAKKKAKKKAKSVRKCMKFSQTLGTDEESVDLTLTSKCKFEVVCSLEWELSCSTNEGTETAAPESRSTTLEFSDQWSVNASAASCEEDWKVGDVRWSCVPAQDSP